jgi:hypothetical protein
MQQIEFRGVNGTGSPGQVMAKPGEAVEVRAAGLLVQCRARYQASSDCALSATPLPEPQESHWKSSAQLSSQHENIASRKRRGKRGKRNVHRRSQRNIIVRL